MSERPQLLELAEEGASVAASLRLREDSVPTAGERPLQPVAGHAGARKKPCIARIAPSPLLERLADFLPVMRKANADLVERGDAHLYNIEAAEGAGGEPQGQVIEMSFGLGIYGAADGGEEDEPAVAALLPADLGEYHSTAAQDSETAGSDYSSDCDHTENLSTGDDEDDAAVADHR